jgi:glycosyltransferase involved in cell wall biosynthesis
MVVGLVTPYFPDQYTLDSGIANHYLLLAQSLAARGNQVVILHVRERYQIDQDSFSEQLIANDIHLLTYKITSPHIIKRLFRGQWAVIDFSLKLKSMGTVSNVLNRVIRRYNIDIIETTSYFSLCYFSFYKKIHIPIVVRVSTTFSQILSQHYPFSSRALDILGRIEIAFIKKCKYLITHAGSHASELEKLYGIDQTKFEIVPHGITLPDTKYREAEENPHPIIKVLYTGRFEYRKGTDILLEAIPKVLQENKGVLFELIGHDSGHAYQNAFTASQDVDICKKVTFRGRVDEQSLSQAYSSCDIFVAPSRYESFGLIFIEAMSYGKPVIACDVGGVSEIVTKDYNGLFAESGNAESLANEIVRLIKDQSLRQQLGANARKTVERRFTGSHLAANSIAYYQTVLFDFKC